MGLFIGIHWFVDWLSSSILLHSTPISNWMSIRLYFDLLLLSRTNCLKLLILIDLPCCCLQLEFLIIRHIFYHLLEFHNSSLNFHSEILAGYFIKSTKKEYFVKLIEIVPGFHYCSASCFANCFSTPKIDRVIIIGNFQRSIFI
jgi:hypothetical protein